MGIGSAIGNLVKAYFEFGAITTVDINSEKVFRDVSFAWSKRFTLAGLGSADIIIDPTAIPVGKTLVILPITFKAVGAGPIFGDIYAGTDADDDGTSWAGGNRDNRSLTTPDLIVRLNPNINDDGTLLPSEILIPSNGQAAVASFGGESKDDLIFIARTDVKYMFRLSNQENTVANCLFVLNVFEALEA